MKYIYTGVIVALLLGFSAAFADGIELYGPGSSTGTPIFTSVTATGANGFCFDTACLWRIYKNGNNLELRTSGNNPIVWLNINGYNTSPYGFEVTGTGNNQFIANASSGNNGFAVAVNGARIDFGAGASDYASSDGTTVTFAGPINTTGVTAVNLVSNDTAPTISSGFGTSPSIATNNGTISFTVNVGTGGTASSGVIGLPTATNGWVCNCADITTPGANITRMTATSTTSCTVTNVAMSTGTATAWTASDILHCTAVGR